MHVAHLVGGAAGESGALAGRSEHVGRVARGEALSGLDEGRRERVETGVVTRQAAARLLLMRAQVVCNKIGPVDTNQLRRKWRRHLNRRLDHMAATAETSVTS